MSITLMKSLRFTEFGPPSVLRIEAVAIPEPGEKETLVRVKAAAINPSDVGDVAGRFKKTTLPRTPGRDFAGIVVKGNHPEGTEVWGSSPTLGIVHDGSHAEYVVVPAETLSPKPKSLSMAQAAAIGVPYITAWASLVNAAQIQAGETILIVGDQRSHGLREHQHELDQYSRFQRSIVDYRWCARLNDDAACRPWSGLADERQ
jgi:NADPH:quinone reductase-like Zn-dependent oxidoreductase